MPSKAPLAFGRNRAAFSVGPDRVTAPGRPLPFDHLPDNALVMRAKHRGRQCSLAARCLDSRPGEWLVQISTWVAFGATIRISANAAPMAPMCTGPLSGPFRVTLTASMSSPAEGQSSISNVARSTPSFDRSV